MEEPGSLEKQSKLWGCAERHGWRNYEKMVRISGRPLYFDTFMVKYYL